MENFDDLIKIKTNNIRPGPGKILISEPFLYDYYFRRSVVLLAEHNKDGSFGVIINKPMSLKFDEVVKDFPDFGPTVCSLFTPLARPSQAACRYSTGFIGEAIWNR